jgi:hypothetical protein
VIRRLLYNLISIVHVCAWIVIAPSVVQADPITASIGTWAAAHTILASFAVSAISAAASYGLQRLLVRNKTQQQGKRTGAIELQDSEFGRYVNEVYGARIDGKGGVKHAGNIIDASIIRKQVTTSTAQTGGKGAPKQKVEKTSYYQDLDIAFGKGRQRVLQIIFVGGAGMKVMYDVLTGGATGIIDPTFDPEDPYDYFILPNPETADPNPALRYSLTPTPDAEGMIEVQLTNGGYARIYEGNDTQLPDPLFESVHGVGSTSAYRGICHIVFESLDITDGHPNILIVSENMDHTTLGDITRVRAQMAGVELADLDFTDLDGTDVRGFIVSQRQAPRSDMELLGRVYDADFFEDTDGQIKGVLISETVVETIDADYIGAMEGSESSGLAVTTEARETDEVDLPFRLEASCFNPNDNFEALTSTASRAVDVGQRVESIDLPMTLTSVELQRFVNRELQEIWRAAGSFTFKTTHFYSDLTPTQKIAVPFGGELREARIKAISGSVPGVLTFTCIPAAGIVLDSLGGAVGAENTLTPAIPANTVITLIDVPRIQSQQDGPGYMWAAAPRDIDSGAWSSAALYVDKGAGYQVADIAEGPATMGRVVTSALPDVPGGWTPGAWDAISTVTVDLFYGELETLTEAQVLDGDNVFVIGDEVVGIRTWTAVGGHPNRWTGSNMQRQLKGTASTGHVVNERIVLLNNAVRFVRVDESEKDVPRTFKAVTLAPVASQRLEDAAPVDFEWTGETITQPSGEFTIIEGDTIIVNDEITFDDDAARAATIANLGAQSAISSFFGLS